MQKKIKLLYEVTGQSSIYLTTRVRHTDDNIFIIYDSHWIHSAFNTKKNYILNLLMESPNLNIQSSIRNKLNKDV